MRTFGILLLAALIAVGGYIVWHNRMLKRGRTAQGAASCPGIGDHSFPSETYSRGFRPYACNPQNLGSRHSQKALELLIEGPRPGEDLHPAVSPRTQVESLTITEGTALVSFSKALQEDYIGGAQNEANLVTAIVHTLIQFPEIERVQILIAGEVVETIGGHMAIDRPLSGIKKGALQGVPLLGKVLEDLIIVHAFVEDDVQCSSHHVGDFINKHVDLFRCYNHGSHVRGQYFPNELVLFWPAQVRQAWRGAFYPLLGRCAHQGARVHVKGGALRCPLLNCTLRPLTGQKVHCISDNGSSVHHRRNANGNHWYPEGFLVYRLAAVAYTGPRMNSRIRNLDGAAQPLHAAASESVNADYRFRPDSFRDPHNNLPPSQFQSGPRHQGRLRQRASIRGGVREASFPRGGV